MTTCAQTSPQWSHALGNPVNSVAVSPDGTFIVAATYSDVWKQGGNQALGTYGFAPIADPTNPKWSQVLDTTSYGIYWVALSADGKFAAAGGKVENGTYPKGAGVIQAFDAASGNLLLDYYLSGDNQDARVNKVALSGDGSVLVAVAGTSLYVSVWNGSAYPAPTETVVEASPSWVDTVAVSDDGAFVVAGASSGNVHVYKNAGGTLTPAGTYAMPGGASCRCAVFSPGGHWFAVCGGNSQTGGAVCLFNATTFALTPKPVWSQLARGPLYYVTLPSAGTLPPVAAVVNNTPWTIHTDTAPPPTAQSSDNGQVALLKAGRGLTPIIQQMFSTALAPNSASFDPTGRFLAVADGYPPNTGTGNFYLLDGTTLACIWTYPTSKMSWPIQIAANGAAVAAGSDDGSVYLFKTT